jgi:hypothetical protein
MDLFRPGASDSKETVASNSKAQNEEGRGSERAQVKRSEREKTSQVRFDTDVATVALALAF